MRLLAAETEVAVAGVVVVMIAVGDAVTVKDGPAALDDDCAAVLDEGEEPVPLEDDAAALEETDIVPE